MSDRLTELQRQRTLAQEQLAWIDREIAKETGQGPSPAPTATPPAVAPPVPATADAATMADEILARYKGAAAAPAHDVKRGCFLYFGLAFLLLAAGLVALYFYSTGRR